MIQTDKFVISFSNGTIKCDYRQEPSVRITTLGKSGTQVVTKPFSQVFHTAALPVFTAQHLGGQTFEVDLDCGAQRWVGPQPAAAVRAALRKCGVTQSKAKQIVSEMMKGN